MLRNNPDERPQEPVGFAQEIRDCLSRVERRQAFARRFGIPFVSIIPRTSERPRLLVPRRVLAFAILALMLAALAAILLPEPIRTVLHRNRTIETIGVPIGVPEASSSTDAALAQATAPNPKQAAMTSSPLVASAKRNATPSSQASPASGAVIAAVTNAGPPAEGPENRSPEQAGSFTQQKLLTQNPNVDAKGASADASESPAKNEEQASLSSITASNDRGKAQAVTSAKRRSSTVSKQGRIAPERPNESEAFARAAFLGLTPDGSWILRLPSGRIAIVAPPDQSFESRHRRVHRVPVERQRSLEPPPYLPMFPPDA